MLRRVFSVIVCLSILMLCSCNPGDVCGPGKIIDCARNCIDESEVNNSIGDGTCDENLNCSEFDYDGGDCGGTNPTTTTTTIDGETTTTTTSGLDNSYTGTLELRFSNAYPEFDESTTVSVDIDINGTVTIGTGSLYYEGEDDNGQSKLKRSGTLTLAPYGNVFHANGGIIIEVDENTSFNERFQQWVWDGTTWIEVVDENISGTWNGGLGFDLDEAVISGSTVGVTNAQGSVIWTLTLTPTLVD